jgi:hypothetical protein
MREDPMSRMVLVLGVLFILLALVILVFADGLRRWYSGIFFGIIGTVTLLNALRRRRTSEE